MSARRYTRGRALLIGAALALSADMTGAGKAHQVVIEGLKFVPERTEVQVGDMVVWKNRDVVPHNVIAGKLIQSTVIDVDKQWQYVAREKGEIPYLCTLHPGMRGTLVVK